MCTRNALAKTKEEFSARDPLQMAELSGAQYSPDRFSLAYCGLPVTVAYPGGAAELDGAHPPLSYDEKVLLLQYLSSACGLPPRGQWLSFLDLRGGPLHWLPFQREALNPLAWHYHDRLDHFLAVGLEHGGEKVEMGDAAVVVPVLPRLSLAFILWQGDTEFPPRGMILFDSVAEAYLSTAALYVLAIQAMVRIWFPGDTRFEGNNNSTVKE